MMIQNSDLKNRVFKHQRSARFLTVALACALIFTACNPKKVEREKDEAAVSFQFDASAPELERVPGERLQTFNLFTEKSYGLAEFRALDLQSLPEFGPNRSSSDRDSVLMTLAPFVLLQSNLSEPAITGDIKFNSVLHRFNRELISLMESTDGWRPMEVGSDESRERMIVEQYIDLVEYGCNEVFRHCAYDHVFRKDSLSAIVLATYLKERWGGMLASRLDASTNRMDAQGCLEDATCKIALSNYYRYLRLAISLRGGAALEPELAQAYIQYGQVYAYYLEQDKERLTREDPGFQWSEWRQQHTNYYKNALAFNQDKQNSQFVELVTRPEVFLCHRNDPRPFCMELLKEGSRFIQCDGLDTIAPEDCDRNGLHKNFVAAIQQMQTRNLVEEDLAGEDPSLGVPEVGQPSLSSDAKQNLRRYFSITYTQAFNEMSRGVHKNLLKTLEIERVQTISIPFYLIDSLYHGRLHPTDATQVWNGVDREARRPQDIDQAITHYLKLEVARLLAQTNEYMTRFYNSRESYDTQVMVARAIEESREISTKWFELNSRIERIRDFVEQSLRDYESFGRLNETLQSIGKNVKYLSVYPNMMILSYFMANEKFELLVRTWFGNFTIDANGIISSFFEGRLSPWFLFGGDNTGLHKYQILLSFFYALQTETFDVYERLYAGNVKDELKSAQVNIVNFFKAVMGEFLVTSMQEIEKGVLKLRSLESNNSVQEARRICRQLNELTSDQDGQNLDALLWAERLGTFQQDTSLIQSFYDLSRSLFAGVHGASVNSGPAGVFGSIYSPSGDSRSTKMLTEIRTNLAKRFLLIEVMVDILKVHYDRKRALTGDLGPSQLKKLDDDLREIQRFIDNKKAQVAEVATRVFRHEEVFGDCLFKVVSVQRNRMKEIFRLERDYATRVHGLMSALRRHPSGGDASLTEVLQGWESLFEGAPRSHRASVQKAREALESVAAAAQESGVTLSLLEAVNLAVKVPKSRIQKWFRTLPADFDAYCTSNLGGPWCGLDTVAQTASGALTWNLHKTDFYFRIVGYLKEEGIAPNVTVNAPSTLAQESSFKNGEVSQIRYEEDPTDIHRQVLQLHGDSGETFTSWVRTLANTPTLRYRLEFLSELYRVGEQSTVDSRCLDNLNRVFPEGEEAAVDETAVGEGGESGPSNQSEPADEASDEPTELVLRSDVCPIRGTKELPVKTLIESQMNLLVSMGLDEQERVYLSLMGRDYLFERNILQGLFLETNHSDRQESLLERIFVFMKDDKTVLNEAQIFYEGLSSIGYLLFSLPDEVQCRVRNRFKNLIEESYFTKLDDYLTYTREVEAASEDFFRSAQIYFEVNRKFDFGLEGGALGLLDPLEIRDYNASSVVFHQRETSGFYLNRDRQFGGVSVRANDWNRCQKFE